MHTKNAIKIISILASLFIFTGCATHRESSSYRPSQSRVIISEDNLPSRKYTELGQIDVSIKKLSVFNSDPTKEQANQALIEKAITIGADAVINVIYKAGVGLTTWGYMDAKGTGVKLTN